MTVKPEIIQLKHMISHDSGGGTVGVMNMKKDSQAKHSISDSLITAKQNKNTR